MGTFLQDLRYGARMLWKRPVLTAITVLTLALGIGANSAIFSVVNAVLVRPLPFPDADRLIMVEPRNNSNGETGGVLSPPDFKDLRERNSTFQQLASFQSITMTLTGDGSDSERVLTGRVSSGFFEAFGIQPLNGGRVFSPDEEKEGANGVVILSHSLWQQRYGADPEIVGKTINLNGQATTVVGVMPESFQYPREAKMWVPMSLYSPQMSVRRYHNVQSIGRLKPGVTVAEAQADMSNIASQLEQAYPESNKGAGIGLTPLPEWTVGNIRSTLLVLMGAVGFFC